MMINWSDYLSQILKQIYHMKYNKLINSIYNLIEYSKHILGHFIFKVKKSDKQS